MIIIITLLYGCGKEDITEKVTLKQKKIEVGTKCNIVDLFECENDVEIGVKNAESFDINKVGSYSIDLTITKDEKQADKCFIIEVYDEEPPVIKLTQDVVEFYEGSKFNPKKYASCTDNSGEDVEIEISENNTDTKTPGDYVVKYSATDSSSNTSTAELKVKVKKIYSYSEMLKLVKKTLKQKKYKDLKYLKDSTSKIIWVEIKNTKSPDYKKKSQRVFRFNPYWSFRQDKNKKKYYGILIVYNYIAKEDNYVNPLSAYVKSDKGNESTFSWSRTGEYDPDYVQCYESRVSYFFKKKQSENLAKIMSGSNVKFVSYEDHTNYKYAYAISKKELKYINLLSDFYNEIMTYIN